MSSMGPMATALSDTEVEVKDRLSSKLWEWSATSTNISNTTAVNNVMILNLLP